MRPQDRRERTGLIVAFLLPAGALYGLFVLYPMARAFYISLFYWRGLSPRREWAGLDNFRHLLKDGIFWQALQHNGFILGVSAVAILVFGLFFAVALSRRLRGTEFFRFVYLFPNVMSVVAVGVLWSFIYHPRPEMGLVNGALRSLGLEHLARPWLGDPQAVLPSVAVTYLWATLGFYIVLFLAGIKTIPPDLYDAARIDGAGEWAAFWRVTLPLLWETLKLGVVFVIINALNLFALVYVMTNEGHHPDRHPEVLLTYLYEQAFKNSDFGYGTAIGAVLFLLIFGVSLLSLRLMRREVVEF